MLLCYTPALAGARRIRRTRRGRTMEVRLIEDRLLWNRFIAETATGHLCQTYEWPDHSGEGAREGSLRLGVLQDGGLLAAMLLVKGKATGIRASFFYVPRGPVCADPNAVALAALVAGAKREARRRGGFMIRAEPNVPQDDTIWPAALRRLGFRPTDHMLYLRGAWGTDLRPAEDKRPATMMTTWRQNNPPGGRKGGTVPVGSGGADPGGF